MEKEKYNEFAFADAVEARLSRIQSGLPLTGEYSPAIPSISTKVTAEIDSNYSQAEEMAAMSGTFDPFLLLPATNDPSLNNEVLKRLEIYCTVQKNNDQLCWILSHSRRSTVLHQMIGAGHLTMLDRNKLPKTDLTGDFIRKIVFAEPIALESLKQEELLALSAAMESLCDVEEIPKPDLVAIKKLITTKNFIDEYESMLKDGFVGREKQLSDLKKFITSPSKTTGVNGIFLSGTGGSGKTTLIAKLVQDIVGQSLATISILDFDKPGIDPYDNYWREQEMTRHIGYQYPEIKNELHLARVAFREARQRDSEPDYRSNIQSQKRSYSEILSAVTPELKKVHAETKPLVIILDTFEEALQQNAVEKLFDWCYTVVDKLHELTVKFIFSGRALEDASFSRFPIASKFDKIKLDEFDDAETAAFLAIQKTNPQMIPQIIRAKLLPHRPLELKLLARVINNGYATVEQLRNEFIHTRKSARHLFLGLIYKRVLDRIDDKTQDGKNVKKLAYPGLVLRYITVELIEKVLKPVLRIKEDDNFNPAKVLDGLANYAWLASRDENGEVRHRKDLRRTMLRLIFATEPKKAARISEAAIRYFTNKPGKTKKEEAEILYHRLLLTDTPFKTNNFDLKELKSVSTYLLSDAGDLPRPAEVLLEYATRGKAAPEDFHLLPDREILKAYDKNGNQLTSANNYLKAYHLYKRFARKAELIGQRRDWEIDTLIATAHWNDLKHLDPERVLFGTQLETDPIALLVYSVIFYSPTTKRLKAIENVADKWIRNRDWRSKEVMTIPGAVMGISRLTDFFIFYERQLTGIKKKKELLMANANAVTKHYKQIPIPIQRSLLRLDLHTFLKKQEKIYLHATQIKLDPAWIEEVQAAVPVSVSTKSGHRMLEGLQKKLTTDIYRQKSSAKNLLSILDSEKTKGEKYDAFFPVKYLQLPGAYFRGPDPEFRNPARFAILEAFKSIADLKKLLKIIKKNCFVVTDDMKEEVFLENITANPEEALIPFIELVDRSWKMKSFLVDCVKAKPNSAKLKEIKKVYVKWDTQIDKRLHAPHRSSPARHKRPSKKLISKKR